MTRPSLATVLRHALCEVAAGDAEMRAICDRLDTLVVVPGHLDSATLPVTVVSVAGDVRIGGIGDRRRATVALLALADGDDGPDVAESLTARWRELVRPSALEAHGLGFVILSPSEDDGDAFDLREVPTQIGRSQLTLSVAATVLDA